MADSHELRSSSFSSSSSSPSGEVDHVELLSSQLGALLHSTEFGDVTFLVEDKEFKAHRVFLASRCEYFRALLYGGMREAKPEAEIALKDTSAQAFGTLLKYVYTGRIFLGELREEHVLDLLGLAHKYGFLALESAISGYLKSSLDLHNICHVFDVACLYQLKEVLDTCLNFADAHAVEILSTGDFCNLSKTALIRIIKRDSFCAPEVEIFRAVQCWILENAEELEEIVDRKEVLSSVRLPLIGLHDLFHTVRPSGLFTADAILDAIKIKTESRVTEMNFRGHLDLDENVALPHLGAEVIEGEGAEALLDSDTTSYDMDKGFTIHYLEEGKAIVVALGRPTIINTIRMLLWDRDLRSYSYYIEISMDSQDWVRVIDYSKYLCHSWQILHFDPRVVRYIRLVGTHNTVNRIFHVVHFECMYSSKPFKIGNDNVLIAQDNVASVEASATVIEGVSRSRNVLLNNDIKNYDWDSGYTCHQLGSGAIVVQLAQPYIISSMRLLLWDCDDRSYSYYIEVSNNRQSWETVVDQRNEECRSWQTVSFPARVVTFIRIVGTRNSVNEVFHCVHFECPASSSPIHSSPPTYDNNESGSGNSST